jgi:hypothetical protein
MSDRSLLIVVAVFATAFGVFVWLVSRRRGDPVRASVVLTGLVGVYLAFWATLGGTKWLLLPGLLLLVVSYLIQAVQVHPAANRMSARSADRLTGAQSTAAPLTAPTTTSIGGTRRWTGAAAMPGTRGLVIATVPLGLLKLEGRTVTLQIRPRLLRKILGVGELSVTPDDGVEVFPTFKPRADKGIGIHLPEGSWYYFGTSARGEVLSALAGAGFTVSLHERQAPL